MTTPLDHLKIFVNKGSIENIIPLFSDILPMQDRLALLVGDLNAVLETYNNMLIERSTYEVKLASLKSRLLYTLTRLTPAELGELRRKAGSDIAGGKTTNILFVQSLPKTENRLQPDLEFNRISDIIKRSNNSRISLEMPLMAARYNSFVEELNKHQPVIVHFTGHGVREGIIMSTADNKTELINTDTVCKLFRALKGVTDCILLNACDTSSLGAALSLEAKHVIGMRFPISDMAATNFAETFYTALCNAPDINYLRAFQQALTRLMVNNDEQVDTPQMWVDGVLQV